MMPEISHILFQLLNLSFSQPFPLFDLELRGCLSYLQSISDRAEVQHHLVHMVLLY